MNFIIARWNNISFCQCLVWSFSSLMQEMFFCFYWPAYSLISTTLLCNCRVSMFSLCLWHTNCSPKASRYCGLHDEWCLICTNPSESSRLILQLTVLAWRSFSVCNVQQVCLLCVGCLFSFFFWLFVRVFQFTTETSRKMCLWLGFLVLQATLQRH